MPSDGQPKCLVIGCGSIGSRHTANLRQIGVADILVYDPDAERREALAERYAIKPFATLDDAYAQSPDVVLVCSPTSLHLQTAREALAHVCDVFVEKPIAHTHDGAEELVREAAHRGRILMVGYNLRFKSTIAQVKTWLDEDAIGHVVSARFHFGSYLPWRHPWEDYRVGYGARRELGGGVILDAIHEIDCVQWFFGQPDCVFCVAGKFSDLEIDTEDVAEILMSYQQGRVVSVHLDYLERPHSRWFEIIGNGGIIHCDMVASHARRFDGATREWTEFHGGTDPNEEYLLEMRHFLDCVRTRRMPLVDAAEAARSLVLALAIKQSASARRPVALTPRALADTQVA